MARKTTRVGINPHFTIIQDQTGKLLAEGLLGSEPKEGADIPTNDHDADRLRYAQTVQGEWGQVKTTPTPDIGELIRNCAPSGIDLSNVPYSGGQGTYHCDNLIESHWRYCPICGEWLGMEGGEDDER